MAHIPGIKPFGDKKSSGSLAFEEFVPPSAWTEDSTCHYLLVDLPGFKRQELKLQVDSQTHIIVSGERQVRENKYKRFEQRYELPKNADIDKITGKLDGEILYISVPKKAEQEIKHGSNIHGGEKEVFHEAQGSGSHEDEDDDEEDDSDKKSDLNEKDDDSDKKSDSNEDDQKHGVKDLERKNPRRDSEEDWGKEADMFLRLAIEKLRKNKGIVMTAIFAFSLGVLVTQKLQSNGQ